MKDVHSTCVPTRDIRHVSFRDCDWLLPAKNGWKQTHTERIWTFEKVRHFCHEWTRPIEEKFGHGKSSEMFRQRAQEAPFPDDSTGKSQDTNSNIRWNCATERKIYVAFYSRVFVSFVHTTIGQ